MFNSSPSWKSFAANLTSPTAIVVVTPVGGVDGDRLHLMPASAIFQLSIMVRQSFIPRAHSIMSPAGRFRIEGEAIINDNAPADASARS